MPVNPFRYPQSKHRRRQNPPSYAPYRRYKPILKQEFASQCVYCRLPDGTKGDDTFGVDHYCPQSKFPELATTYTNLFYACNCCNRRKGAFWPTDAQWHARQFIPNPCDEVMFAHLQYHAARVDTKSPAGQMAEQLLMLNDEYSVEYREFVLHTIAVLEKQQRRVEQTIHVIDERITSHPEEAERLSQERAAAMSELAKLERSLSRLDGTARL